MPSTVGTLYGQSRAKSPAQIPAGKCEFTQGSFGVELTAPQFHGTAGTMLRSKHGT